MEPFSFKEEGGIKGPQEYAISEKNSRMIPIIDKYVDKPDSITDPKSCGPFLKNCGIYQQLSLSPTSTTSITSNKNKACFCLNLCNLLDFFLFWRTS